MSAHLLPEDVELAAAGGAKSEHLSGCAACQQAVASATGRRRLLEGVTGYTLSDAGFSRVEAAMLERLREPAPSAWSRLWPALALAAVAALAFVAWPKVAPVQPPAAVEAAYFEPLRAVLVQGTASVQLGAEVTSGAQLDTGSGRVVLASATAQLELRGQAAFGQPRASVALTRGAVRLDVSGAPRWVVGAGAFWVGANDAAFIVTRVGADEVLEVQRGSVFYGEWADRAGRQVTAPATVTLGHGAAAAPVAAQPWATRLPMAAIAATTQGQTRPLTLEQIIAAGSAVSFGDLPVGAGVELDGQAWGAAPLSMLLPEGKHHLRVLLADGSLRERDFELGAGQNATLALPEPTVHAPPREPRGGVVDSAVDSGALRRWVAAQTPKLSPCYEKWLKATPEARGQVTLTVSVSAAGRVQSARVEPAGTLPAAVSECLVRTASKWRPPARELDVEIPLVLGAH